MFHRSVTLKWVRKRVAAGKMWEAPASFSSKTLSTLQSRLPKICLGISSWMELLHSILWMKEGYKKAFFYMKFIFVIIPKVSLASSRARWVWQNQINTSVICTSSNSWNFTFSHQSFFFVKILCQIFEKYVWVRHNQTNSSVTLPHTSNL